MSAHDAVAAVEDALVDVLFSTPRRRALHSGDDLGLPSELAADLRDPTRCDVDALSAEIRARLPQRANRGVGRLQDVFERTVAAFHTRMGPDHPAPFDAFLASAQARRWRPVPYAGLGPCLEECFARWAQEQAWSDAAVVEHELLSAVSRALAADPTPAFVPPAAFHGVPGHWVAVTSGEPPVLYAAVHGRVVTGPVTPLIAGVVLGEDASELAQRLGVPVQSVHKTRDAVAARGLLRTPERSVLG